MTEHLFATREHQPDIEIQLREACIDLRVAMQLKEGKTHSFHLQKSRMNLQKIGALHGLNGAAQRELIASKVPTQSEVRQRLRDNMVVPIGTQLTGEGHAVSYFWSVRGPEESVRDKSGMFEFGVYEVTRDRASSKQTDTLLYTVNVSDRAVLVWHEEAELQGEELAEPLNIIQEARGLYV